MTLRSSNLLKHAKIAKMDHLSHPKKSAIFETFGQNFPIQLIEEGSTLHFLSKSAKKFQTSMKKNEVRRWKLIDIRPLTPFLRLHF